MALGTLTAIAGNAGSAALTERQVLTGFQKTLAMTTPFRAQVKTGQKAHEPLPGWEIRSYHATDTGGALEGVVPAAASAQTNLDTKTKVMGRFIKKLKLVGASLEANLMHGQYNTKNLIGDSIQQATEEIYRDVESQMTGDIEAVPGVSGAGGTASVSRSFIRWMSNGNARFTDAPTTPDAAWRTPAAHSVLSKAAVTDITEDDVSDLITQVAETRNQPGMRFTGWCSHKMRQRFDSFSKESGISMVSGAETQAVYRFNQKLGTIDRSITFYKSSNGDIALDSCGNMDPATHFFLATQEHLEAGYVQPLMASPETSSSPQLSLREVYVLYVNMPTCLNSHGLITSRAAA